MNLWTFWNTKSALWCVYTKTTIYTISQNNSNLIKIWMFKLHQERNCKKSFERKMQFFSGLYNYYMFCVRENTHIFCCGVLTGINLIWREGIPNSRVDFPSVCADDVCNYFSKLNRSKKAIALVNYLSVDTFTNSIKSLRDEYKIECNSLSAGGFLCGARRNGFQLSPLLGKLSVCRAGAALGAHKKR